MSAGQLSRRRSISHSSRSSRRSETSESRRAPLEAPKHDGERFEACAATASFFLYAQRSIILCLHHDTLAIERRFERHREDVLWISADIVSERGAGRLVVSYDVGQTTIVWDLMTGGEVARFASFEEIRVATWMRNGNIAFGKQSYPGKVEWVRRLMPAQAILKGMSFCSSHPRRSIYPKGLSLTPLQHWHQRLIAEHLQLGL